MGVRVRLPPSALKTYSSKLELKVNDLIIDLETTSINPELGEIIALGIISENKVESIIRENNDDYLGFLNYLKGFLEKFSGRKVYAYNAKFERDWIEKYFGIQFEFFDLMKIFEHVKPKPKLREVFPIKFLYDLITELNLLIWSKVFSNFPFPNDLTYICDNCKGEFNSYSELAYVQYKEKIRDKYEIFEMDICLNCLRR